MAPLVSVIMPCHNAGRMLEPALWSVFAQTWPNLEFIFVDNNSTDGSAGRALAFAEGKPRPFRIAHCPEQGANNARNLGYTLARGDYVQWMDADDALGVEKIALQVEALERDPDSAIAYCDWMSSRHLPDGTRRDNVNALNQVDDQILRSLSGVWYPPHSYLIRRDAAEILQAENAWLPETKIGTDVEYSAIAAMLGMRFRHVPSAKVQYNTWSNTQISGAGTPYDARIASLRAIWRRLGAFAQRPDVAPRITATHRSLLDQDWNVWAMPPGSVEIATLSATNHSLCHVASGRTLELDARDATIATVLLAMGLNRAVCHHAVQIAAGVPALRNEHAAIVVTLERFRRRGFLTLIESGAEASDGGLRPAAALSMRPQRVAGSPADQAASERAGGIPARQATPPATRDVVAKAWTEVLHGRGLAEDQRFDAAGGDSLALLNFALSCEARLGVSVSLDALSPRMRPSDFANVLDRLLSESHTIDEDVVAGEPALPTIFLIRARHHMDQSEAALRQASAGLAQIVPMPLPPWPVLARKDFDFPALLDHIAGEIEPRIGTGPVLLFGFCFGGMLAHAAATRLAASGRRIGFLAILDGDADWALSGMPSHIRAYVEDLWDRRFSGPLHAVARWIAHRPALLRWIGEGRRLERLPRKFAAHLNWHLNTELPARFDRGGLARLLSEGGRLDAPVFLLRSLQQAQGAPADLHWRRLCARLTVVPVLGSHVDLFARENLPVMLLAVAHVVRLGLAASGVTPSDGSLTATPEVDYAAGEDAGTAAAPRNAVDHPPRGSLANPLEHRPGGEDRWTPIELALPGHEG
jgi:thioesterase domain-containing protein